MGPLPARAPEHGCQRVSLLSTTETFRGSPSTLLPSPHQLHELQPLVAMVWGGPSVVYSSSVMVGHTDSAEAAPTLSAPFEDTSASTSAGTSSTPATQKWRPTARFSCGSRAMSWWTRQRSPPQRSARSLSLRLPWAVPTATQDQLPLSTRTWAHPCALLI